MINASRLNSLKEELEAYGLLPHELHLLARALRCSENDSAFEERLRDLSVLALAEIADWIVGRKRFATVSESDVSRVLRIFLTIRQEVPTVECLADHFGIAESRSRSMLSRMNYGEARQMKALTYRKVAQSLQADLAHTKVEGGRKRLTIDSGCLSCVNEAVWAIMSSDEQDFEKKGKYVGAERPDIPIKEKQGAVVLAKPTMWNYIITWLEQRAREIEGRP